MDRAAGVRGHDFTPEGGGAAKVGAEQRTPAIVPAGVPQREAYMVADKAHLTLAGHRVHDEVGLRHVGPASPPDAITIP